MITMKLLIPIMCGILAVVVVVVFNCVLTIHGQKKIIYDYGEEIERINRKLFINDLDKDDLRKEINKLHIIMDFINKWREHGLEALLADDIGDSYYNNPIWKEFHALDEDVQYAISDYVNSHTEYLRKLKEDE